MEREQSVHCPLECEYLQESRKREEPPIADPSVFPHADIRITEEFLRKQEPLLLWIAVHLLRAALETPGAVDSDIKEALEGLVTTYRTLQSGLVYETRPANTVAAAIFSRVQLAIDEYREQLKQATSMQTVRDADILGVLAFLQRMEIQRNNGRRLGRAFVDFLRTHFPQTPAVQQPASSLLI